jgi:hypothetical protein
MKPSSDSRDTIIGMLLEYLCSSLCSTCLSVDRVVFVGYPKEDEAVVGTPERCAPKSPFQFYKHTHLHLFSMLLLSQDEFVMTSRGKTA